MSATSPLNNSSFRNLFLAQVIALVGTGLSTVALTLLAYEMAGNNAALVLGTALAIKMVAYVLFAPIFGAMAHRLNRKTFLISMDIVRACIVLSIPLITHIWQIYVLIFFLNLFSAGFKPVFSATIPDVLTDEKEYTKALSLSRLAYDLENLLSPLLAGFALLFLSYSYLFTVNAIAFLISSVLIALAVLPASQKVTRQGFSFNELTFGVRSYLKTPRLRGLLALYMGVASASAMIIVNTVNYIRDNLGGSESDVAMALSAAGFGSMLSALLLPRVLDKIQDRTVMLSGAVIMAIGMLFIASKPTFSSVLVIWFLIGLGWSLVQTPAGRVVNRSSSPGDRTAYFSAQFSLSHACWLIFYLLAGFMGTYYGMQVTAILLAFTILFFTILAGKLWPRDEIEELVHSHAEKTHEHAHIHDEHHQHDQEGWEGPEPHCHPHYHAPIRHTHSYVIDDHHATWPESPSP